MLHTVFQNLGQFSSDHKRARYPVSHFWQKIFWFCNRLTGRECWNRKVCGLVKVRFTFTYTHAIMLYMITFHVSQACLRCLAFNGEQASQDPLPHGSSNLVLATEPTLWVETVLEWPRDKPVLCSRKAQAIQSSSLLKTCWAHRGLYLC